MDTGLATIQNRIELAGLELREEHHRLADMLMGIVAGVFLALVAVVVLTLALAYLVSESVRPWFLLGAGLLYAGTAAAVFLILRSRLRKRPPPFAETLSQLRKDREWLGSLKDK